MSKTIEISRPFSYRHFKTGRTHPITFSRMCYLVRPEPSVSVTQTPPSAVRLTVSSFSARVIAAAIILLFLYYAAGVVITLLFSILLAYFLDPAVEFLERLRLPRTLGAMVMVLVLSAVLAAVAYGLWTRVADFAANWPKYSAQLQHLALAVQSKIQGIEGQVSQIAPTGGASTGTAAPVEPSVLR